MKTYRRNFALLGLLSIAPAGTALAGTSFTSVTHTDSERTNGRPDPHETKTRYVIDGLASRVEFLDGSNPMMPAGTYQISTDGGKTRYMVDPQEKTYYPFDPEGVTRESAAYLKGAGMEQKVENVKIEKLIDEGGPTMLGLSTRHYKYRISYTMTINMMGTHTSSQITTESETWSAPKLAAAALWLRPAKSGIEGIDKLMTPEMYEAIGFPLKMIHTSTTKSSSKKGSTDRKTATTSEVTELTTVTPAASTFEVPAGYQKTEFDMMKIMMKTKPHEKREKKGR